jgi:Flp pilus assembly protein CpaB
MATNEHVRKRTVYLAVAAAIGLTATLIVFAYLGQQPGGEQAEPRAQILVAARDLTNGVAINPDNDIKTIDVPATMSSLITLCVPPDLKEMLRGRHPAAPIPDGAPILYANVAETRDIVLKGDERALSIPANGPHALSGLLAPGDRVKLYVTTALPRESAVGATGAEPTDAKAALAAAITAATMRAASGKFHTELISDDAFEVLAVGRDLASTRRQLMIPGGAGGDSSGQFSAVTLKVNEAQAQSILEKTGAGQLPVTFILCPRPNSVP